MLSTTDEAEQDRAQLYFLKNKARQKLNTCTVDAVRIEEDYQQACIRQICPIWQIENVMPCGCEMSSAWEGQTLHLNPLLI